MKIISESQVQNKKEELNIYRSEIEETIASFNTQLEKISETIEALKTCANTYGGSEKIKELCNLNFNTKILNSINEIINNTSIYEEINDAIISETM